MPVFGIRISVLRFRPQHFGRSVVQIVTAKVYQQYTLDGLGAFKVFPGDQNSPKALYSMVFGPESLKI